MESNRSLQPLLLLLMFWLAQATHGMFTRPRNAECMPRNLSNSQRNGRGCLARLATHLKDYEICADASNTTCYLFLSQAPFVIFNQPHLFNKSAEALELQRPFKCGSYAQRFKNEGGIEGTCMRLHGITSSSEDYCMWGGHSDDCKFNELVHFITAMAEKGYRFAISNALIDTPSRRCRTEPGAPIMRDNVVIFGSISRTNQALAPVFQVLLPFHIGSWLLLALVLLLLVLLRYAIAIKYGWFRHQKYRSCLLVLVDNLDSVLSNQSLDTSEAREARLALTLFRTGMVALLAIFALFYEIAVVNFLFEQRSASIAKDISSLSQAEVNEFSVPARSALEDIWKHSVTQGWKQNLYSDDTPWKQCAWMEQCFEWLTSGDTRFVVSFEVRGKYLMSRRAECDKFALFETRRQLYEFNTVWLYNERCSVERRRTVDREILSLRMDGTMDEAINEYSGHECIAESKSVIVPAQLVIPMIVLVLPAVVGVVVIVCRRRKKRAGCEKSEKQVSDDESACGESIDVCVCAQS